MDLRATLKGMLAVLALAGCGGDENTTARRAAADAAVDAASGAALEDPAPPAEPEPEYAPPAHVADCAAAEPIAGPYQPHFCAHTVTHPDAIRDVRPSCGAAGEQAEVRGLRVTFPDLDPSRNVAIGWTTGDDTRVSEVHLGDHPDRLDRVYRGHSFTWSSLAGRVQHEVHLCGLAPGRTYYYRAGGEGAFSEVASFSTAPPRGSDEELVFGVTGDTRSTTGEYELWVDVVRRFADEGVDFLLFGGDAVEIGLAQGQWDGWFQKPQPYLASLPIVPTNGNHDLVSVHWLGQLALPNDEENFAYRYGNALIISMNDLPLHDWDAFYGRAKQFLDDTLTAHADARWKIVLNHRAFFSASKHGATPDLQEEWLPIIDRHGVDLVFNGHDHNYERTHPIRDMQVVEPGQGTVYVIPSGMGAPLYDNGQEWWTAVSEKVASYAIVRVAGDRLEMVAYRIDGTVLDRLTLTK